jgi:hypothetical protein
MPEKTKKQRPPDRPEDRFFANFLDDGEFYDKNGNRIYPKKKAVVVPPVETPPADTKIETPKEV